MNDSLTSHSKSARNYIKTKTSGSKGNKDISIFYLSRLTDRTQEIMKIKSLVMDLNGAPLNADSIIDKVNLFTSQKSIRCNTISNDIEKAKVENSPSVARKEKVRHIFKK
jgi:hypothetical protein